MTIERAQEIRAKIEAWEAAGKGNFAGIQWAANSWQAFVDEIGITIEELDEYVTLDLMGCLESDDACSEHNLVHVGGIDPEGALSHMGGYGVDDEDLNSRHYPFPE